MASILKGFLNKAESVAKSAEKDVKKGYEAINKAVAPKANAAPKPVTKIAQATSDKGVALPQPNYPKGVPTGISDPGFPGYPSSYPTSPLSNNTPRINTSLAQFYAFTPLSSDSSPANQAKAAQKMAQLYDQYNKLNKPTLKEQQDQSYAAWVAGTLYQDAGDKANANKYLQLSGNK